MKKNNFYKILFLFLSTSALITGCELLNPENVPNWTVSVNEIVKYPRASIGEKEVQAFDGRPIWVRRHYEFSSKSIKSIVAEPIEDNPGYYKLNLELDKHGSLVAMRLCNDPSHAPWALLVKGVYYRSITFNNTSPNDDYTKIVLNGPFDRTVANALEKYSTLNYEHYHKDDL